MEADSIEVAERPQLLLEQSDMRALTKKVYACARVRELDGAQQRGVERHVFEAARSEEHTSELQSRLQLVCRLLLEKKKKTSTYFYFFYGLCLRLDLFSFQSNLPVVALVAMRCFRSHLADFRVLPVVLYPCLSCRAV